MGIGWMEIVLIIGIILIVCGTGRFRAIGRSINDGIEELKREVGGEGQQERAKFNDES